MKLGLTYTKGADGSKVMSMPEENREWVISFVRENARKSPEEIEAIIEEGHADLLAALEGVSEAQAAWKPGVDDWLILELLGHVVSVKQVMGMVCANLRKGELPPGFGPQFEEAKAQDGFIAARFETLEQARAAEQSAHVGVVAFVRSFDDSMNTDATFRHFY